MKTLFGLLIFILLVGCSEGEETSLLNKIVWDWQAVRIFVPIEGAEIEEGRPVSPGPNHRWVWTFNPEGSWAFEMLFGIELYNEQAEYAGIFNYQQIFSGEFTLKGREMAISVKEVIVEANTDQFTSMWNVTKEAYAADIFKRERLSGNYTVWVEDGMLRLTKSDGKEMLFKKEISQ